MDLTLWCTQRILISTFSSCCLVWIVVVSVYKLSTPSTMLHKYVGSSNLANRNSLQEVREGYRAIHAKNSSVPFPAVLSDFCAHFTGDPHTEFYLNYTSTSANNLRYDAYSKVSRNLTAKYHFAVNSAPGISSVAPRFAKRGNTYSNRVPRVPNLVHFCFTWEKPATRKWPGN